MTRHPTLDEMVQSPDKQTYLLGGMYKLSLALSKIDSGVALREVEQEISNVCTTEFCENGLIGQVRYIPPEKVREESFGGKNEEELKQIHTQLQSQNYFQSDHSIYVPLRNNGQRNLGILAIEGIVPRFLTLDEEDKNLVLDYLGAQGGQILASARFLEATTYRANYDHLTGLLKKDVFLQKLEEESRKAKETKVPLALIMLDLDKFHPYNGTYGHLQGDTALREIGEILRSGRPTDFYGRFGGEEFFVLLPNTDLDGALKAAERIRSTIAEHRFDTSQVVVGEPEECYPLSPDRITVSVGVAVYPEQTQDTSELLKLADTALRLAKGNGDRNDFGRNRVKTIY